jgi:hypothetical protein
VIVFTKGSFDRDVSVVSDAPLLEALKDKIKQLEVAVDTSHVTGLKMLSGYSTHCRIYVKTDKLSFRIGAIVRGDTIWLIRFLSRQKIYQKFP